jgi:cell division protein FtsN
MTRDYAKKPTKVRAPKTIQKKNPTKIDRLGFLIVGIFFGILISPLLELSELVNQNEVKNSNEVIAPVADNEKIPEFEFYTLLKEAEVIVPESSNSKLDIGKKNSKAPTNIFMLQTGSFKTSLDADTLRKKLEQLDLNTSVEIVTTKKHEVWNRVMVGPFYNLVEIAEAQKVLNTNKVDSLLLKREK